MLWVGVVNQGTYTSVTDLHNNVCTQKTTLFQQVQVMDGYREANNTTSLPKG